MNNISETDGVFKEKQRKKIKSFLDICKYDLVPSAIAGGTASLLFTQIYSPQGAYDAILFGSVSALALTLAVNAGITGIKLNNEEKKELLKNNVSEEKEKQL